MAGKIKSIHGIYKKHGREAFLEAAAYYSDHVNPNSIDKTIDEMESRWYDATHRQTEAEKMVEDYNNGQTILNDPDLACTDPVRQWSCERRIRNEENVNHDFL